MSDHPDLEELLERARRKNLMTPRAKPGRRMPSEWWTPVALIVGILLMIGIMVLLDYTGDNSCAARGGEYHRHGNGGLCLPPGTKEVK